MSEGGFMGEGETQDFLNKTIDDGAAKIAVSFEKVDFVSSAGLRVLFSGSRHFGHRTRVSGMTCDFSTGGMVFPLLNLG